MQTSKFITKDNLIIIYKAFIQPHLDYGDVLYDQTFNNSFKGKMESIQYNACLALTGAIRGTLKKKKISRTGIGVPLRSTLV